MPPASRPRNDTLLLISHLLAAALGHWLWSHKTEIAATTASVADFIADFILDQLEWFMTAKPAGSSLSLLVAKLYTINFRAYTYSTAALFTIQQFLISPLFSLFSQTTHHG